MLKFSAFVYLITHGLQLNTQLQDEVIWKRDDKNSLTVRSVYFAMKDGSRITNQINTLWKMNVLQRFKVINRIRTTNNLKKRGGLYRIYVLCAAITDTVVQKKTRQRILIVHFIIWKEPTPGYSVIKWNNVTWSQGGCMISVKEDNYQIIIIYHVQIH
jgi:hypothetical protein